MWPLLHFIHPNINLKWIMALNVKGKIMKYLGKAWQKIFMTWDYAKFLKQDSENTNHKRKN